LGAIAANLAGNAPGLARRAGPSRSSTGAFASGRKSVPGRAAGSITGGAAPPGRPITAGPTRASGAVRAARAVRASGRTSKGTAVVLPGGR
jgi:hypothetical protein